MSDRAPHRDDAADADGLAVEVRRGMPTAEELAALLAVVSESYAGEVRAATVDDRPASTPWSRSQRALRTPLRRDVEWGRFAG